MERLIVLVLTFVTLVAAKPHGYGVKGGASAKADASAVVGGFGDLGPIPLSIPAGSAYSGSFSKSSASSFASSSASSSSSSYSFSGSATNGNTGISADKGCSTGTCPLVGAGGSSSNGVQQLSGANAVSAAQAKAQSGSFTPCQGPNCNESPAEKCTSGQCLPDSALKGANRCTGGENCQTFSSETNISNESSADKDQQDKQEENLSDSNDFAVNINRNNPQSKQLHDSNGQYSNKEKSYNSESDCSNGKCGPVNSDQASFGGNQNQHPVPSTYLTTPNKTPPCTTPNCNYPSQISGSQSGNLPSSYNVPIQSATNPPNTYYSSPSSYGNVPSPKNNISPGVPCTSPNCNSTPYGTGISNIPDHNGQQGSSNRGPCASGHCDIPLPSDGKTINDAQVGIKVPNYSQGGLPSNVPSKHPGQLGCTTPYCSGLPTHSGLPTTNQPGVSCTGAACSGLTVSGLLTKPSDSNAPMYTGGFGGPAGFLDINSGSNKLPGNSPYSHNTPGTTKPPGVFGSTSTLGTFGTSNSNKLRSNNNYDSTQISSHGGSTGAFEYNKPSNVPSTPISQFNPSTVGGYGGPTSFSAVPLKSPQQNGVFKPTISNSGSSLSYSGSIDDSTGLSHTSSGPNSILESFGVTKPNIPPNSLTNSDLTGSFGGALPTVSGSSIPFSSTNSFDKPGIGNCGSGNCNSQSNANSNGVSTSYDKTSSSTTASSQNKPTYTGGFGGPTGLLNPNNFKAPYNNNPTVSSGNIPCGNGNCDSKATSSSIPGSSATIAHNLASASASANAVAYSGGFGGPPGFLKPYDDGTLNTPAHGNLANGPSLSSHTGQANTPLDNGKNSSPGGSTNGVNSVALATAVASAGAGGYSENNNYQNNNGQSRGCNSGCSPNGAVDGNFELPNGLSKHDLSAGSLASAKSSAGATAYGNFASSSASAHASAGAATKGGYGRK